MEQHVPSLPVIGIGTDIVDIERIKKAIERQGEAFLRRLFTEAEQAYCAQFNAAERHYAGRFCAKEAIVKAAGIGLRDGVSWLDIEILNNSLGQPQVRLQGHLATLLGPVITHLSISHCHSYATATALILANPKL
jgi:holo-[acyl-carrier protein] synthase